jgi:hypothetical protein
MINQIVSNLIRFIVLVLVQVLILNNVQLNGYINPFMYILFIMLLPIETPGWLLLLLSLAMGLTIDMFSNTLGMHAAACVFIGYLRPRIIRSISPRDGYESEANPNVTDMGFRWFISYTIIMVLLHHFVLFFIEAFSFVEFFSTLFRVILSSILTILLIIISQYLFTSNKQQS